MPYLKNGEWKAGVDLTPGDLEDDEETEVEEDTYPDELYDDDDPEEDYEIIYLCEALIGQRLRNRETTLPAVSLCVYLKS